MAPASRSRNKDQGSNASTSASADPDRHRPGGATASLQVSQPHQSSGKQPAPHSVHHAAQQDGGQPRVRDELGSMALLVLLYCVQGVPLGLTTGALPFMLSSKVSYTQMGIFALAAYPYSLKLLWSPIVDSLYWRRLGRRKSWIVPIQLITAWLLIGSADWIQHLYDAADVNALTSLFFVFVFLMATQDIAVDGWALTLLSPANVSYASTCQTVGQTTGIFTSFTIFLALQDAGFCNKYIRGSGMLGSLFGREPSDAGLVTLAGYMRGWGWIFAAVTALIAVLVREAPDDQEQDQDQNDAERQQQQQPLPPASHTPQPQRGSAAARSRPQPRGGGPLTAEERALLNDGRVPASPAPAAARHSSSSGAPSDGPTGRRARWARVLRELGSAYVQLWRVVKLPAVWKLTALLLTYRVGVLAAEGAASLKLIDKGVAKETLAFLVLFQFPVELLSAVIAGRWAAAHSPYWPFIIGYFLRLATASATVALVAAFPAGASSLSAHGAAFASLAAVSLATSFVSHLGFTSLGSFYNTISDPEMGGAYLTLLNTIANMGYLLPRTPLFWVMDVLTVARCAGPEGGAPAAPSGAAWEALACPKKALDMHKSECVAAGGSCALASDGYYVVSGASLAAGLAFGLLYLRFVRGLMREPLHRWRPAAAAAKQA